MKKLLLMIVGAFMLSTSLWAKEIVSLSVNYKDERPIGHDFGRTSVEVPLVYIDDYTLTFEAYHPDYALVIMDEDGDVVYTTLVFSAQTDVILPSTLSGDYQVNLVIDNLVFTGWIAL